ncbi:MAG: hypothetical protein GYB52_03200 [Rhodospirillales bacterium]|nr:hypothetical protein [Rhodospirillales bacterium]MBR9815612.1 hypothetical protein [Rhodospirillales bacterium]
MTEPLKELSEKEIYQNNEEFRKKIISSAHMFASEGIKALMLLNGGALVALPAFKALSADVSVATLFPAVVCFVVGLTTALITTFLVYASLSTMGNSYRNVSRSWEQKLARKEANDKREIPQDTDAIRQHNASADRLDKLAIYIEVSASLMAVISLVMFIAGSYQGLLAFYSLSIF